MRRGFPRALLAAALAFSLATTPALGHGGDVMELKELKMEPAATLAEQALAELELRHDAEEAGVRLDAALETKDRRGVDMALLTKAMHAVDNGDPGAAIPLIDKALSRPPGAPLRTALHEAGREFQPGTDTQEIVAIGVGAALVLVGLLTLLRSRAGPRREARA